MIDDIKELEDSDPEFDVMCPFFEMNQEEYVCAVEMVRVKIKDYKVDKHAAICFSVDKQPFLNCPAYQKAMQLYRTNPAELNAWLKAANAKLSYR